MQPLYQLLGNKNLKNEVKKVRAEILEPEHNFINISLFWLRRNNLFAIPLREHSLNLLGPVFLDFFERARINKIYSIPGDDLEDLSYQIDPEIDDVGKAKIINVSQSGFIKIWEEELFLNKLVFCKSHKFFIRSCYTDFAVVAGDIGLIDNIFHCAPEEALESFRKDLSEWEIGKAKKEMFEIYYYYLRQFRESGKNIFRTKTSQ